MSGTIPGLLPPHKCKSSGGHPFSRHTLRLLAVSSRPALEPPAGATVASAAGKVPGAWGYPLCADLPGAEGRLLPQVRPVASCPTALLEFETWMHVLGEVLTTTAWGWSDEH